jgi:hypothetical protein
MMVIKCELGLPVWIWSSEETFTVPQLNIKINNRLHAKATIVGELRSISDPTLPSYKSYYASKGIQYTVTNSKETDYPTGQSFEELTAHLGKDILRVHNRTVDVLRGRLKGWQLTQVEEPKDYRTYLTGWKTKYRRGSAGRFAIYRINTTSGLRGLLEAYQFNNFPQNLHFDFLQVEDISEWLEENKPITVTEQLLVQAMEAERSSNLRLAVLNYMTALEQILSEYLNKKINQKLGPRLETRVKKFLRSDNTKLEDRLYVVLPLVIHKSWLRDIDFDKIKIAIEARNKIAHGETVNVADRYSNTDWDNIFINIRSLIDALTRAAILTNASAEIKAMAEQLKDAYNTYPTIWVHRQHRVSVEIVLYSGDPTDEQSLAAMANNLSQKRAEQDTRFSAGRHLTVDFYEYPKEHYARWRAGSITFINNT